MMEKYRVPWDLILRALDLGLESQETASGRQKFLSWA